MRPIVILALVALAGTSSSGQQRPTFRASVRLVETSVLVHARSGQPVADLSAADFRIYEDGLEQKIEVFTMETERRSAASSIAAPAPATPPLPGVFTNRVAERITGGVTVILFDRLNSSMEDQKYARDQLIRFLATIDPAERIALYVLESDAVTVLHDFTSNASQLIAVVNRYLGSTSVELVRSAETAAEFELTGVAAVDADTAAWLQRTAETVSETFLRRRVDLTTTALVNVANHLAGIPGRKNLVWVSGAFPFEVATAHGPEIMDRQVSRATRAINHADVAVYPVDIRGLMPALDPTKATATVAVGARPTPVFTTIATTRPNQDSMEKIAADTGGRAFLNANAIGRAVGRAMDDSRVSYVLGYYSSRPEGDFKFRKIDVKVNRNGLDVRHRKGYFALPPAPRDAKTRLTALERVMQSPIVASAIALTAQIDRAAANKATVVVRVDPAALTWDDGKDVREAAMDVVISQSTPDGKYFLIKETTVNLTADPERYKAMVEDGLTLSSEFTQRSDAYRLHVVVSDVASQSVGSLIIPIRQ